MKKRYIIVALGIVAVLLGSFLVNNVILAQNGGSEYDPWMDLNDDGIIDVIDLQALAFIYGTSGTSINKTELLLELEARIDGLNASLLADYYNKTDCDSLFALLAHMHSGSDISGGTLAVDQIRLGTTEGNRYIDFYEDGSPTGEYIMWWDTADQFYLSDDTRIAGTIDADTFTMNPTTRYYSIPATAWQPSSNSYTFVNGGYYIYTNTAGVTAWFAAVNLPHGALVTEVTAWVWDQHLTEDITVRLYKYDVTTGSGLIMASVTSSGGSASLRAFSDFTIESPTIDNQNNEYYLRGDLTTGGASHRFGAVRITYTIDEPLP